MKIRFAFSLALALFSAAVTALPADYLAQQPTKGDFCFGGKKFCGPNSTG